MPRSGAGVKAESGRFVVSFSPLRRSPSPAPCVGAEADLEQESQMPMLADTPMRPNATASAIAASPQSPVGKYNLVPTDAG